MMKHTRKLAFLLLALVLFMPLMSPVFSVIPPLAAGTYPVGTIVVPMDGKQNDRIHVYGLIHEFLRNTPNSQVARVIEPPDVTMQTSLTPAGDLYQGGPFLIDSSFNAAINTMLSNSTFSQVTVTQLTSPFTSNRLFFVRTATKILVIGDGYWGKTFLTLQRMGISYDQVTTDQILANPSLINQYTLIVLDSPGWYGNPIEYTPDRRAAIQSVYNLLQTHTQAGNEVIFTDTALLDLNSTFPGYITLNQTGLLSTPTVTVYPSPKGGFAPEFPSQYYNPPPNPNTARILTEEGTGQWVPTGVPSAHAGDVRVIMDSGNYGYPAPSIPYAILAFYFPFGNGIVEGLAFQPYEQLYPLYADQNGYYATYEIYGNKFVHGPQNDFLLSATPLSQKVTPGQSTGYTLTVTSLGSFSSQVNLQVTSGLPFGAQASITPNSVTPSAGGSVSSSLTISTSTNTPPGSYNITITGTSTLPLITRTTSVTLVVTQPISDFTISVSPSTLVVNVGQCKNMTVTVISKGNFSAPVNITRSALPSQVSVKFAPNPVTPSPGGTVVSILTICVGTSAPAGTFTITITGTSGTIVHSYPVQVTVPPPPPAPPLNWLVILLILGMILLALVLAFLAVWLSGKRRRAVLVRPRAAYVLPLPTVRCRYCGRIIPLTAVYCPYCGRMQGVLLPGRPPSAVKAIRPSRKFSRNTIFSVILTIVSGLLVMLNAALMLVPSIYAMWSGIFFWLPAIGPTYAFALGMLIGLTLIFGALITVLGNGALADVVIIPFAVFSLIIGGGFIAGFIIGVVAGIIGALKR